MNNYKWKTFRDIFGQLHTQGYNDMKKQIVRLQLNEKKSKESQTRLMRWYWKRKRTWRMEQITCNRYNSHPWIMFTFIWLIIIWSGRGGGCPFKIVRPRTRSWKNFGRRWTREVGDLANWTFFLYIICVSSLLWIMIKLTSWACLKDITLQVSLCNIFRKFLQNGRTWN